MVGSLIATGLLLALLAVGIERVAGPDFLYVDWCRVFFLLVDLFEKIDDFIDHQASLHDVARFYIAMLSETLRLTLPVNIMLATTITLGILARHNVVVAFLASGVSMLRFTSPILLVSTFAVLASVFPPEVAEQLQQVLYTIALPMAFRHALPEGARRRGYALAIFPFLHGYAFFMGFSSFSWSLVPFFWTLGIGSRSRGLRSRRALVALGVGALATAVAHVVTFVALLAALVGLTLGG